MVNDPAGPASVPPPAKIGYLPTLDGWRALAIGLVLIEHGKNSISEATNGLSTPLIERFPDIGLFGVRIFFAISGFLICSRLIDELIVRGRISLKGFYIRRFFRIIPPLMALMIVVLGLSAFGAIHVPIRQWLAGIFFAANYLKDPAHSCWYVAHLWSLAVEEHFYLLFPGILAVAGFARGQRVSFIAAATIVVWRSIAFRYSINRPGFSSGYFWYRTDILADGLFWGCVVAFLYAPSNRDRLRAFLGPVRWSLLCMGLILSVPLQNHSPGWKFGMFLFSAQALLIPIVMVGTVMHSGWVASRILESHVLRWVGRLSYSLYLWQQVFFIDQPSSFVPLQFLQRFPTNVLATLGFATLSYYALELPMMRLGHRLARPVTPGRTELASVPAPQLSAVAQP
jgi:peptidoglycan/LPS O-acetylase OafA/YrhL